MITRLFHTRVILLAVFFCFCLKEIEMKKVNSEHLHEINDVYKYMLIFRKVFSEFTAFEGIKHQQLLHSDRINNFFFCIFFCSLCVTLVC